MTTTAPATLTRDALAVLQPGFTGTTPPDWVLRRLGEGLGSVALFARNIESPEQVTALTARLRAESPELIVAADEEGGDVTRLEASTGSSFPGNHALGAVDDPGLTRAVARELGRRLAACGVNLDWAPSADVNSDPGNPVIGVRSFGADPALVARHTAAYVQGLQEAGVAACTKHFPGHGDTDVDSHHDLPRVDADLATLHARELVPFRAAVAAGSKAVMSAHILLPALDPDLPATLSPAALTGLLRAPADRGGLGFDGLIATDAVEMAAISARYGIERGTVLALAAGADAICVGGGLADEGTVLRLRDALVAAVRGGELAEERLADAAARVRALGAWARRQAGAAVAADPEIGLTAARRALRITRAGEPPAPGGPVHVAALTPVANIAVGDVTPWGVGAELARLLPGTATATYREADLAASGLPALVANVLRSAADRRIVIVVRDIHRHRWMADTVHALLAARPDAVVVEMGVPQAPPLGALHIATHGAARVCGRAAAEVIAGKDAGR
ncbi:MULTISPECIES: glycoside hydrolase family 3 protein [Streptomycetaceae]|uniref:Putative sugar hydrolase n=1 Tax=Streptantibioticus cattleyicolor (strain ATCC 35852 / DSM 46488 / JCM 4925 / NBRC 14057 / NRRL 8057) TaxID=1003195 RepID=F8K4U1_STREN|nr:MULTISPECIES: glycoside hydrolase family 3 protein [Streptomycetaceae]AEW96456.1 putative sugar hydrolase [Streptantibioticus cattleyicolor NRRL 8057 = DSM 46488]MYS60962.1 glycoside hydrolase family 3 protein [Streptomyces sp. SID5468]CCB76790.1 putative sugar hydrolase [Streptantibioticus cattleyicolor NRRL 8057 = DSM 46488]